MENYERMKIPTLKNLARERGLYGYSRLKKENLYNLETVLDPS